jgi:TRAP-type mannitol/chloroaromatic compound transport system permease large subunit
MLFNYMQNQSISLGWDFYIPILLFALLCFMAVPVWVSIGAAAITMLFMSGALPLSLIGESLFDGIDAFALTAVPLFILTGDVLVRTGLSRKFLDVADALTCWTRGGFGSATVLVCGMFSSISGSDAAGAAAVGRMTIARLVESGYPRPMPVRWWRQALVPVSLSRHRLPISLLVWFLGFLRLYYSWPH